MLADCLRHVLIAVDYVVVDDDDNDDNDTNAAW